MKVLRKLGIALSLVWLSSSVLACTDAIAIYENVEFKIGEEERELEESSNAFELSENIKSGASGGNKKADTKSILHYHDACFTELAIVDFEFAPYLSNRIFNVSTLANTPCLFLFHHQQVFYDSIRG
jgi:hypothetical protein